MKVLSSIIVPPHLSASGAVRAGRRLSEALSQACDMTLASMSEFDHRRAGTLQELPVRCFLPMPLSRLPSKYRSLFYTSDIPGMVARGDYDLVHLHNPLPALEMARIADACRRRGVPYVVSTHGFNEVAQAEQLHHFQAAKKLVWHACMLRPLRHVLRGAACVFALSLADLPIMRQLGYVGEARIVPNGVEIPADEPVPAEAETLRRLGIPDRTEHPGPACLFLGNHTPNKGVPVLLEAFRRLQCPCLLMLGGERRAEIDYTVAATALRPGQRVIATGRLSDAEVSVLFRRCDLFVFPTRADTFPLVVLEAMAHGRAVLSTAVGGIPYQVSAACGRLVPPGNVEALAAAIEELSAAPERLCAMGAAGRARARTEFTWPAAAQHALAGYRAILAQQRAPHRPSLPPASGVSNVGERT